MSTSYFTKGATLFLLTNHFPYSTQENFLEDEIVYLSSFFNSIYILPKEGGSFKRSVPDNCFVLPPLNLNNKGRISYLLHGFFSLKTIASSYRDFIDGSVWKNKKRLHSWLSEVLQLNNLQKSRELKHALSLINDEDLIYSYWGTDLIKIALLYNGNAKMVSRFHGAWDLWEESYGGYFPFRKQIVSKLSKAFFISQIGETYFTKRYTCDTAFSPLGSNDHGLGPSKTSDITQIVSCSTIYPLKRVDLIFRTLESKRGIKIHWTHLGGGPQYDYLCALVKKATNPDLKVTLLGQVSHDAVMDYYKNHHVDVFINLSTNEGVPVSIMEASSFGIPVVATDVGATREVVGNDVGILVSPDPSISEISSAIDTVLVADLAPRNYWKHHYDAKTNYTAFVNSLKKLLQ